MKLIKLILSTWIMAFLIGAIMGFIIINIFVLNKTYESTVCFEDNCFTAEHAITQAKQERGLSGHKHLNQNRGMLFIFGNEGVRSFWMRGMLIPLDIIWLDGSGTVVYIAENMQPCKTDYCESVVPDVAAKYVLELNAGVANRINLTIGDRATLS